MHLGAFSVSLSVKDLQAHLVASGITPIASTDSEGDGPAHIMLVDPDGNQILVDQHVPRATS